MTYRPPPPPAAFPRTELLVVEGRSFGPVTNLASFKSLTAHLNDPACTIAAPSDDEAIALGVARCPSCSKFYHTIGPRPAIFNHFRHAGATDACRYPFRTESIRALQARAPPGSYAFRAAAALGRHHGDPRTAAAAAARDAPPEPTPLPPRPAAPPASELIGPWLDSVSLADARSLVVPGAGRHPSRTSAPAVYAALAPAYSYLAEHRHSALGVRAVLFRFLARCVIFASVPIADPAYPSSAADRARAVLAGRLPQLLSSLRAALLSRPPPAARAPPAPLPPPPTTPSVAGLEHDLPDLGTPHLSQVSSELAAAATRVITYHVSRRNWRRAYRALSASPLLDDSDATRRALAALHPQAPPPSLERLDDAPDTLPFVTPRRSFDEALAALPMDRAAGDLASGNEELRGVADAGAADHLFAVVSAFNDGTLHPDVYDAFEPSSLFGLRKPNGKARPIAIGDALEALAGRCMLQAKRSALRGYFSSTADLDACLASGDWRAAFAAVPGDPSAPACPDLRTKVLSSVSVSSLRRRVPTCSSSPPLGHPAPRAGGRSFC
ncbi:hypothetical protein AB1Y20_004703 [Prymnesium parvum]|uniref:Uncharacterized protein n=1 Tax=Prymnesium parvum TaxID=97485 RepID=A0AB34IX08_PRYPA